MSAPGVHPDQEEGKFFADMLVYERNFLFLGGTSSGFMFGVWCWSRCLVVLGKVSSKSARKGWRSSGHFL